MSSSAYQTLFDRNLERLMEGIPKLDMGERDIDDPIVGILIRRQHYLIRNAINWAHFQTAMWFFQQEENEDG